ncbi:MAG: methionyl-tRNA formyltransferase, partial [Deltaproteobacteria bacterium]
MKEGLIFMGTSRFSLPSLAKLAKEEDVLAVVTQPDRPKGRGRRPSPTPVKEWALKEGLRVLQPERLDETFLKELEAMG